MLDAGRSNATPVEDAGVPPRRDATTLDAALTTLVISPAGALTVDALAPQPIQFTAKLSSGASSSLALSWTSSPRELGSIDGATGMFMPSGVGGVLRVTSSAGGLSASVVVDLLARVVREGDPNFGMAAIGAGGSGGVGGEGGGGMVSDPALRAALDAPAQDDPSLTWLYPYQGTVWPRGLPAPLLQWRNGDHGPRAIKLHITVDDKFDGTLYLGPPMGVTRALDRLPIPQAVWSSALRSGRTMKVAMSYAASDGAGGYRTFKLPVELSWTIAPTTLKGTVYYNSYGTKLAENYNGAKGGNGRFGGATLAIEGGAFDPKLAAGSTTMDASGCRVCHTVSSDGSTLIALRNDGMQASIYDLAARSERALPGTDYGKFGW
ncbi:MAG TPA: hypothetical protein VI299_30200, partial [Polyangiales bacterium]